MRTAAFAAAVAEAATSAAMLLLWVFLLPVPPQHPACHLWPERLSDERGVYSCDHEA